MIVWLTELLLIFVVYCASFKIGLAKSTLQTTTTKGLLKQAESQLALMSAFRGIRAPQRKVVKTRPKNDDYQQTRAKPSTTEDIIELRERVSDHTATASELLHDPRYQAMMQDRIKRSFISGIANKLLGGITGASGSASRGIGGLSSSNSPSEYGPYGSSYQPKFDIGDFAKAIINTVIQAIKAIGGGAIAGGGALVKGGGYIVSAKGHIISSAGNAITTLGKSIASSAIIAGPQPVHGHPGYSYNHPPSSHEPNHDLTYDGPPPNEDAYTNPDGAYDAGHSSYGTPSNDNNENDQANIVIVKDTTTGQEPNDHSTIHEDKPSSLTLTGSYGGPLKGPISTPTKIIGVFNSGQPTSNDHDHQTEYFNYNGELKFQQPTPSPLPSYASHESNFQDNQNGQNNYKPIYQAYQPVDDIYNSYIMPQLSLMKFSGPHTNSHQVGEYDQPLSHELMEAASNGYAGVPNQEPTIFNGFSSPENYNYHGNYAELLKIPIMERRRDFVLSG